jgi:branched-chain amino acid transport system substrate-binding protein
LIGVDPDGKEIGTGKYFVLAYDWAVWEPFFALKAAIEKSGWKGKADTPKVIKTLEGMAFRESLEFPQGDMSIRAQDHLTVTGLYIEQIQKGELKVVTKIPAKEAIYPPTVDHTKEPL